LFERRLNEQIETGLLTAPLWRTLERASVLMDFDADLLQPICADPND
jgi:hypothetical protein